MSSTPPNTLVLRIQRNEGTGLSFNAMVPSTVPPLSPVEMDFSYSDYFGDGHVLRPCKVCSTD